MLSYPQISKQLQSHVELYNQLHPNDSSLREVIDNTYIIDTSGCYVTVLCVLVGNGTGEMYDTFDFLCRQYQASKLKDIPPEDANRLWDLFHELT